MTDDWLDSDWQGQSTKIVQARDHFEFMVALMLEEEREFNRKMMKKTGYRVGVSV